MRSSPFRALGLIGFGLGPAILLAGCGGDETGARTTLNSIQPSSYVVRPAVTTPPTEPEDETAAGLDPDGRSTTRQEYEVVSGDYPMRIATLYGITLDELAAFNEWTAPNYAEFPFPGTVIGIPPGALVPGASDPEATDPATSDPADTTEGDTADGGGETTAGTAPETTLAGSDGECVEGEHEIVSGDYPGRVAGLYDITVEQLANANAGNPAYNTFIPGQMLRIPCESDDG